MADKKSWIDKFIDYTENSEPPLLYRKWVAVSTIAAALERKTFLEWGTFNLYPNMYIILVGPPAARKGTAMSPGTKMLRKLGVKLAAEAITREALISTLKGSYKTDSILGEHAKLIPHSSLTIVSPELTVFLGYNNVILMADLSDWYDSAERWTYRTKNSGVDEINGIFVNLLGATTPELLQTTLPRDAIGGGLTSRMIFVYEEKKGKLCPTPFLNAEQVELGEILYEDLERIYQMKGNFVIAEAFIRRWITWYTDQEEHPPFTDQRFQGYLGRRQVHILKLSMILSAAESSKMIIELKHLEDAILLLEKTEIKMPGVFGGIGSNALAPVMERILVTVRTRKKIELDEIVKMFYYDADLKEIDSILATLSAAKYIKVSYGDAGKVTIMTNE